ncbi:MAG: CPBP family intramembrane glutamic endopeptidase, partial [Chitinophagaceae bacterium]
LLIRIPFLIIYEIYFRGVLLVICIHSFGVNAATLINVILYAVAHVYSSRKELIGTVPFGLVLCLATTIAQSVWPAIIMHLLLALPYEILLLSKKKLNTKTFKV